MINSSRSEGRPWRPITPGSKDSLLVVGDKEQWHVPFSVVELDGGTLLGTASLWSIDNHNRSAHIGLGLLPSSRGKGYDEFGVDVLFHGTTPLCIERPVGTGASVEFNGKDPNLDKSMSGTGADFRSLTPLVVMSALREAGTRVYEPMHRFRLEAPADTLGAVPPVLAKQRAVPGATEMRGASCGLEGRIPVAQVHELEPQLPGLTRGEGDLECAFDHYAPVDPGTVPDRPRTDLNPIGRKEYLLNVTRRVGA